MRNGNSTTELVLNRRRLASKLNAPRYFNRRRSMLAAAAALGLATSVWGQTTQPTALYFDNNGTASGVGSGTAVWNATTADWNAASSGAGAVGDWQSGDIANFNAGFTVDLLDAETIGGLTFNTGGTTITTTAGTTGEQLNIGTSTYNATTQTGGYLFTNKVAAKQIIAVPIVGSGDIVAVSNQNSTSNTIDFAGNMSQFTGNLYLNDASGFTTGAQYQLDESLGGSGTIYMGQNVGMTSNNAVGTIAAPMPGTAGDPVTAATLGLTSPLQQTPNIFTISNNIELNYTSNSTTALTSANTIGAANGPSYVITTNGVATTYNFSKIITYSGVISSPASGAANLVIGGTRGTVILDPMVNGAPGANTYNGYTQVEVGDNNGLFQIGNSGAIPATSNLIIGSGASVGPTDLDGNSINIAELYTGDTGTTAAAVGNIYNLTVSNPNFNAGAGYYQNTNANPATITIAPTAAAGTGASSGQIFYGDIGDTNIGGSGVTFDPFTDNAPYSNGDNDGSEYVTANTNISLVLNPASGGKVNIFTLAPVDTYASGAETGLKYGNEYTGTTTINSNATLVLGRGFDQQSPDSYTGGPGVGIPNSNFTINGTGDVYVNSGGTLSSLASSSGYAIGGAQGTIYLYSGSSFLPGEAQMYNSKSAVTHTEATTNTVSLSPNNIGTLVSGNIMFDENASMTFSIASAASFDYVFLYGSLNLDDSNSDHNINIDLTSGGILSPGDYNLISAAGGIAGPLSAYALNTSGLNAPNDVFSLALYTNPNTGVQSLQLQVVAPDLQWDPTGQGQNNYQNGVVPIVTEGAGTWTNGISPFYSQIPHTEQTWSNTATNQVIIGDDASQAGGAITLGSNIVVSGGIFFGPIMAGSNYSIINASGNSYTLTIGGANAANGTPGGIEVENSAATSTAPSAEIDVPIILSASQTWSIASGAFLNVTGSLDESDTTGADTLTVTGEGVLDLSGPEGANTANGIGDLGTLSVQGGSIVLLATNTAIASTTTINLNGGGVEYTFNDSPTNPLTFGSAGGAFGATTGNTVTYSPNIADAYGFEVIGTGTTNLNGTVTVGSTSATATLEVAAASGATAGTVTFGKAVSIPGGAILITGGNVTFNGSVNSGANGTTTSSLTVNGNTTTSPNIYFAATDTNTFSSITIAGGTVYAQAPAILASTGTGAAAFAPITFTGSPVGGLNVVGMATLANSLTGTGSGATTGGNSYGDTVYVDTDNTLTITGVLGGTGDLRFYPAPNSGSAGTITEPAGTPAAPALVLNEVSTRLPGGAIYYDIPNLDLEIENAGAMGLSTQSFMTSTPTTINVAVAVATSGDLRGEPTSSGGAGTLNLIKTGAGILALSGSAGSSTPGTLTINNGEVQVPSNTALGGQAQSSTIPVIGVTVNNSGIFGLDYTGRIGGITLNNGGTLQRDVTYYGESTTAFTTTTNDLDAEIDMTSGTAADVIAVTGTGGSIVDNAMQNAATGNTSSTNSLFTVQNPVVVSTGTTLNLVNNNPAYNATTMVGGYETSYILALRGPTAASNAYTTVTIQAGHKVAAAGGPGQTRFGRTNSQGVPIIGQGTPGSDAVLLAGTVGGDDDVYMTDTNANAGNFNTIFVVDGGGIAQGTGTAGLRIEAPMDASYVELTATTATPWISEGTTGLFGINTTTSAGTLPTGLPSTDYGDIGNAYTVASPNRLQALSTPYTYTNAAGTSVTITPGGTLTLAANDAGPVTGVINDGPLAAPGSVVNGVTQGSVALALDNTSGSSGTHIYQINPAVDSNGGSFANFAGLTLERTTAGGAAVTAQLLGTTKVPSLAIQTSTAGDPGAFLDITNQALAVDPTAGPAPTARIAQYLKNSYDHGAWDLPGGIGSSSVSALSGTSIGYAENDLLPAGYQFNSTTNLFGGQPVDGNAVLVKYTWLGDLDLDGTVDSEDLALMNAGNGSSWMQGDLNYDGVKNADDWSLFFLGDAAYGAHGTLTSAVPEPAAASLLVAGAGMLLRRKRRA